MRSNHGKVRARYEKENQMLKKQKKILIPLRRVSKEQQEGSNDSH